MSLPFFSRASPGDQCNWASVLPIGVVSESSPVSGEPRSSNRAEKVCTGSLSTRSDMRPLQAFVARGAEAFEPPVNCAHPVTEKAASAVSRRRPPSGRAPPEATSATIKA